MRLTENRQTDLFTIGTAHFFVPFLKTGQLRRIPPFSHLSAVDLLLAAAPLFQQLNEGFFILLPQRFAVRFEIFDEHVQLLQKMIAIIEKQLRPHLRIQPGDPCQIFIAAGGKSFVARGSFPHVPLSEQKDVRLRINGYNRLKYTVSGHFITLEINGETVDTVELPRYPAMGTVAADSRDSVILKIVNFSDEPEPVEITLDCEVKPEYTIGLLAGNAEAENSIDDPDMVRDVELRASGASRAFVYEAPAMSVNVLTLAKEKPDA